MPAEDYEHHLEVIADQQDADAIVLDAIHQQVVDLSERLEKLEAAFRKVRPYFVSE